MSVNFPEKPARFASMYTPETFIDDAENSWSYFSEFGDAIVLFQDELAALETAINNYKTAAEQAASTATDKEALMSPHYDNIDAVSQDIDNVNAAAGAVDNINAVAAKLTQLQTVVDNISNIVDAAANASNINTVASIETAVNTVAGVSTELQAVYANLAEILQADDNASAASQSATNAYNSAQAAAQAAQDAVDTAAQLSLEVISNLATIDWSMDDIYITETMTGVITNFDSLTDYTVSATLGTASISGDTITYTAPATSGTETLTINGRVVSFSVGQGGIQKPVITSPNNGETGLGEIEGKITLSTSPFTGRPAGADTHASTTFEVATDATFTNIVKTETVTTGDLTKAVVSGLVESTTYYVRAKHTGSSYVSDWSGAVSFTTASEFIDFETDIGAPYGGGYIAGKIVSDHDGKTYGLIVSDGSGDSVQTGDGTMSWRTANTAVSTTCGTPPMTMADGKANHDAVLAVGALADFPAFKWVEDNCNATPLNGYSDWYLPSRDELELCYRNFKPTTQSNSTSARASNANCGADGATYGTNLNSIPSGAGYTSGSPSQTSIVSFESGGADAFEASYYWSSSESSSPYAWYQNFSSGSQYNYSKSGRYRVRAVRRIEL